MRRIHVCLVLCFAAGCHRDADGPPPVLTLVPAAMRAAGAATALDEQTLCLGPGAKAEATVYVHQPTVTMTVTARRRTAAADGVLVLQFENGSMATVQVAPVGDVALTQRLVADRGDQTLRLSRPARSEGAVCVDQVALTQP